MPGVILHTLFAERMLDRWRSEPWRQPFEPHRPDLLAAYFRGAAAPDMGYFPGGEARLSRAAHSTRAIEIGREMLQSAGDEAELAYALGWLTHVVADEHLHPHIDRACSVEPPGRHSPPIAQDLETHIRLELGLDVHFLPEYRDVVRAGWRAMRPMPSVEHVVRTFRTAGGVSLASDEVVRSDRALSRFVGILLGYTSVLARLRQHFGSISRMSKASRRARNRARWGWPGFLSLASPLAPSTSLVSTAAALLESFPYLTAMEHIETVVAGAGTCPSRVVRSLRRKTRRVSVDSPTFL